MKKTTMKADDFRRMALGMKDTVESAHMGHPDFRVGGRIFATLHHGMRTGMVTLTPGQQQEFLRECPSAFEPEAGAWGRDGCTRVLIAAVDEDALGRALTFARQNAIDKNAAKSSSRTRKGTPRSTLNE